MCACVCLRVYVGIVRACMRLQVCLKMHAHPYMHPHNHTTYPPHTRTHARTHTHTRARAHTQTRSLMCGSKVVIMDALRHQPSHGSHFTLNQALEQIRLLGPSLPEKVWFIGMNHDLDLVWMDGRCFCLGGEDKCVCFSVWG